MFSKDKLIKNLTNFATDSRYTKYSMYYDRDGGEYFTNLPKDMSINPSSSDSLYKVDLKTVNRLDLIANMYYNNSKLWWVIAEANKIKDPNIIPLGTSLIIPSVSSIFGVGGVLG